MHAALRSTHLLPAGAFAAPGDVRSMQLHAQQAALALPGSSSPYRSTVVSDWAHSNGRMLSPEQQGQQMPSLMVDLLGEQGTPRCARNPICMPDHPSA